MRVQEIMTKLEEFSPVPLAESWDNVGLLAGDPQQEIHRVLVVLDLTRATLDEAKKAGAELILCYHPPIFKGMKKVVPANTVPGLIYEVIREGMAVYALHTSLDIVVGGINDVLAELVGIQQPQPVLPRGPDTGSPEAGSGQSGMLKLVVFLPPGDLDAVSEAVFAAGAGEMGEQGQYSRCSFRSEGTGTFHCGQDSHPAIGSPGSFEQVAELRFETIVPASRMAAVAQAIRKAHSYEEPAFELSPLAALPDGTGLGRYGELSRPVTASAMIEQVKQRFAVKTVGVIGPRRRKIRRMAVGAGSCGTMLRQVIRLGCDGYLTGELTHHHALELQEAGVTAICLGHYHSESLMLPRIARWLGKAGPGLKVTSSRKGRDPIEWC